MQTTKDASGKHRKQRGYEPYCCEPEALSSRISMIEDGVWNDRNTLTQDQERAAETHREYQANLCLARIERLTNHNQMRTQDWYHELSDQESEDEIDQMVGDEPRVLHHDVLLSEFMCRLLR